MIRKPEPIVCSFVTLTSVNSDTMTLHLTPTDNLAYCEYYAIVRSHGDYRYRFESRPNSTFRTDIKVADEFIKVTCYDNKGFELNDK